MVDTTRRPSVCRRKVREDFRQLLKKLNRILKNASQRRGRGERGGGWVEEGGAERRRFRFVLGRALICTGWLRRPRATYHRGRTSVLVLFLGGCPGRLPSDAKHEGDPLVIQISSECPSDKANKARKGK